MEENKQTTVETKKSTKSKNTKLYILGIVIVLIIIAVGYFAISSSASPVVKNGDTIKVNYTGTFTNGTVFGSSAGSGPLQFTVGSGQVIPGFSNATIGMRLNQEKNVTIPADQAYGPVNPALIISVPKKNFGNESVLVGMHVSNNVSGQIVQGLITKVNATNVTIDFNPPLAGQTLIFKIIVVAIQRNSSS